jgi:uncharacterized membrane protein YidH (DUF202 family)
LTAAAFVLTRYHGRCRRGWSATSWSTTGLAVAAAGIVVFNIAPFLNWVDPAGEPNPRAGYETDSLVPFIAYLGLGLLAAMAYAMRRHHGLRIRGSRVRSRIPQHAIPEAGCSATSAGGLRVS